MAEYSVLWTNEANPPAELGRALGRGGAAGGEVRLSTVNLDEKEAAEARETPGLNIARKMRTTLIRPAERAPEAAPQWGLTCLGITDTARWNGAGTKVAVLDTGIDGTHRAFLGVDLNRKDFTGTTNEDGNGHGTHCAGTIFGRPVDGQRIGVAEGVVDALIGKVLDANGHGTSTMIFDGLYWAIQNGADVISMSIGFDFPGQVAELIDDGWPADLATSDVLETYRQNLEMFSALVGLTNVRGPINNQPIIVAAAGNESRRELDARYRIATSLPAATSHLSVGAVGKSGDEYAIADFSNARPSLVAPGVDIVSAAPGGGLATMSGTSMACPHVAGAAALWFQQMRRDGDRPTNDIVRSHLLATAKRDRLVGYDVHGATDFGRGLAVIPT